MCRRAALLPVGAGALAGLRAVCSAACNNRSALPELDVRSRERWPAIILVSGLAWRPGHSDGVVCAVGTDQPGHRCAQLLRRLLRRLLPAFPREVTRWK